MASVGVAQGVIPLFVPENVIMAATVAAARTAARLCASPDAAEVAVRDAVEVAKRCCGAQKLQSLDTTLLSEGPRSGSPSADDDVSWGSGLEGPRTGSPSDGGDVAMDRCSSSPCSS